MSVLTTDLVAFGCLVPPTPDNTGDATSNIGGGIDATRRVIFTNVLPSAQTVKIKSSAADTRFLRITGRKADGTLITENLQLNGTTAVTSTNTFDRILKVDAYNAANTTLDTGSATLTISVFENDGTTLVASWGGTAATSSEVGFYGFFIASSSDPVATKTRYEKFFYKNMNATFALQNPTIQLTADTSTVLTIAVENANGGTTTTTNRLTAPGAAMTAFGTTAITVPAGSIAAGAAVAVWVKQALAVGNAPISASFQTTIQGQST